MTRYLGGKTRIARRLVESMKPELSQSRRFVDAMCGMLSVTVEVEGLAPVRLANDACRPLITLLERWREGWRPPTEIDERIYNEHRDGVRDPLDPMTAFLAFGCSYSGAWWNGWARPTRPRPKVPHGEVFADAARRSLDRKLARCRDVEFSCKDFSALDVDRGDLVYFDPEYRGTRRFDYYTEPFPYDAFVSHASALAQAGIVVFVSEYESQPGWERVAEFRTGKRSSTAGAGVEILWRVRG